MSKDMEAEVKDWLDAVATAAELADEAAKAARNVRDKMMYRVYQQGYSLADIAAAARLSRTSVHSAVKLEAARAE